MKRRWLDRALLNCSSHYTLCLTEKDFHAVLKAHHLPLADWPNFIINAHSNATTHFLYSNEHCQQSAVVCLRVDGERTGAQIAGILVHEAVHIFQQSMFDYGEKTPSDELQAYGIQTISQRLMESYTEQTNDRL